jgi:hypothetical protein
MRALTTALTLTTFAVLALTAAAPAAAQHTHQGGGGAFPTGWQGRVDRATQDIADVRFMAMGEAFHIVTGPHVILWHPSRTADGAYVASATFSQRRAPERLEGFGLLVGGRDLDGADQDYLYFLVRHDGRFMVRHRGGDEVHTLAEWTESAAVARATAEAGADNTLAIEARTDGVVFRINGTEVFSLPRTEYLNTDGLVGLRVGHHLDVHVRDITVQPPQG